ncbi:MAG: fimbrial biogenesis chaperone [Gammaproteobacteria bacterium]
MRAPFTAGLLIGCFWGAQSVYAGSLEFTPLRINLSQQTSTEVITVKNNGGAAVVVQLQLLKWAMDGEKDVYAGSDEVLATPPIFTLPVAASQVVRVGLTQPVDARREQATRGCGSRCEWVFRYLLRRLSQLTRSLTGVCSVVGKKRSNCA